MEVLSKARKQVFILLAVALCLGVVLAGAQLAGSYPGPGSGFEGWTAEVAVGPTTPRHAQMAHSDGLLHLLSDNGANIYYYRASDEGTLNWTLMSSGLDYNTANSAADPYIYASGTYVVASWKEYTGSTWALVVAVSSNHGTSWSKWIDSNPACNNFEGHVWTAGSKIHVAYASDYDAGQGRRNEVYYRRFNMSLSPEHLSCPSGQLDGVAANWPCIEATSSSFVNVYYQYGSASLHPIWESYTTDSGATWNPSEKMSVGSPGVDFSCPEVAVWMDGADRRKMVAAQALNAGIYEVYTKRYASGVWDGTYGLANLHTDAPYPQISTRGTDILVVYRQSGGTINHGVAAQLNNSTGENTAWHHVNGLFYSLIARDLPGCVDCCSDGSRFFASAAGTGSSPWNQVLTKREDNTDPNVVVSDPGGAHNASFAVSASASDEFNRSEGYMCGPSPYNQAYDSGVVYTEWRYRLNDGSWNDFPGGLTDSDSPWSKTFDISSLADGSYDFWVRAFDTSTRYSDGYFNDVVVDRAAPTSTPGVTGGEAGDSGWYVAAPTVSCNFADDRSGVGAKQYNVDGGAWSAYGSGFAASEGDHTYTFRCQDNAGNWSANASVNVKLDTQDPSSQVDIPAADGENGWRISQAAATITLSGSDPAGGSGLSEILYAWNGTPNASYSEPFVAPEGVNTLNYIAVDNAGNQQVVQTFEVKADYNDPAANIVISDINGNNGWYKEQPAIGPTIEGEDGGGSGIFQTYYRFDSTGDWNVYSTPFALLEGDAHTINYYSRDIAGRCSSEGAYAYKADFTDPTGEITSPAGGSFARTELDVSVSADDTLSGVDKVDFYYAGDYFASDNTSPYSKSYDISGYADGESELQARVFDSAGRSSQTALVNVKKDTRPPTVEITEPVGDEWIRGMVTVKANIEDANPGEIGKVDFYLDGELFDSRTSAPWMGSLDTTRWGNDWHTISVRAWDKAGNASAEGGKAQVEQFIGNNISETNYFAEGCTRQGFDTWLCLQNPGDEVANVTINYMLGPGQGQAAARNYAVPPNSRMTVNVNTDVGPEKDVSIQATSSKPVVSERPMYFDYSGLAAHSWKGGHTAQGVSVPGREWYLAEGCTRDGFEEWLCIQNPGDEVASVDVSYMLGSGQVINKTYGIAPWQRYTISVNQEIGPGQDVSVKATSNTDIVIERPMYFLYQGVWDGGHNTMAVNSAHTDWYFAEGCTRAGFNQWICIQNPGDEVANVDITYMTEDGTQIVKQANVAPHSRHTINANVDVAREHDVSTKLVSDNPVIVERPMYFWYGNMGGFDEGSCAIGANKACSTWYLAEGCTRQGFEEWICLQNPNDETATVRLTYMLENASCPEQTVSVASHTRLTVRVNDFVGPDHDVSTEVQSSHPIIVERPMYSLYRGVWPAADSLNAYTFER